MLLTPFGRPSQEIPGQTKNPHLLKEKNENSFNGVFTGLNVAGFAMQYMKRSRPVSGQYDQRDHSDLVLAALE